MASPIVDTTFTSGTTITSNWLNGVNDAINDATQDITGATPRTIVSKLSETISVKDFGAVGDGVTDDSASVLAAAATGKAVYFPSGTYKFSVTLLGNSTSTFFYGDSANATNLIPLSATKPCFILNFNLPSTTYPKTNFQFSNLRFTDSTPNTSCGIWTRFAIHVTDCYFEGLKYGVIGNTAEWSVFTRCVIRGNNFGIYATTANAANDPLGITTNLAGNPSEWYFYDCWFLNQCQFYQNQPDNIYDSTCELYFNSCQLMSNTGGVALGVVNIAGSGEITFDKCWWEGMTLSNTGETINGKAIPASIVYSEGGSVTFNSCIGALNFANPVYVSEASSSNLTTSVYSYSPYLNIKNTNSGNGKNINLGSGVVANIENGYHYGNGGLSFDEFTTAKNLYPARSKDAGILFPSPVWATNRRGNGPTMTNHWYGGTCAGTASTSYGATSLTIKTGDGFIDNGGYKYLEVVANDGNGISSGDFTTINGYFYVITFGIRSSGVCQFRLTAAGAANSPAQYGFFRTEGLSNWQFFTGIAAVDVGGTSANVKLLNVSGSAKTWDMSAIQIVQFSTLNSALRFVNSGVYVDPVVL